MIKELYCKLPTDKGYQPKLETTDEVQMILQQIRMILGTKPGDILGAPNFGIDLQQFLFSFNNSPERISYLVNGALSYYLKYNRDKFSVGAEVKFGHNANDPYEYAVIDIIINQQKILGVLVNQE